MIRHVIWASMIDYPGHISTVLFTGKCNFDCSYCYNKTLAKQKTIDFNKEILPKLLERKDFVNHVVISGGEPTVEPEFNNIVDTLYKNGFTIGIHTNGSHPEIIQKNIDKINFYGVDIKTSKEKYNNITGINFDITNLKETVEMLIENNKNYEFRTTLFPKYVENEDVLQIAEWLNIIGAKKYYLQQFYSINGAEEVDPYTFDKIQEIRDECNKIIPTVLKTK